MKQILSYMLLLSLLLSVPLFCSCGNLSSTVEQTDSLRTATTKIFEGTSGVLETTSSVATSSTYTSTPTSTEIPNLNDNAFRIALLINGNLGDMSIFDSANDGMLKFAADYPDVEIEIIEMGSDEAKWEPTLRQTADAAFDLIIVGTTDMREPLKRLVRHEKYADGRFIIFDAEIEDNNSENYPTVHSILFKQNEGGYLAGLLSALVTINTGSTNTGFIGGMQTDTVNDFGYGFVEGVQRINKEQNKNILAFNAYVGDSFNSPKGKYLADTMYGDGANILFVVASQAGLGCLDSAKNNDKFVIGIDSDLYSHFSDVDPEKANCVVTSVLKRVDLALYKACERFITEELSFGDLAYLGVAEDMIDILDNANYQSIIPEPDREYINSIMDDIACGSLVIGSGLKRFTTLDELYNHYGQLDPTNQ